MSFPNNYENDCDCIDICSSIDSTYSRCFARASLLTPRCTPAEKAQIILLNQISNKLDSLKKSKDPTF
ncbi:hypothetical protein UMC2_34931 [[Clostridium] sordellii]|uniref:hypothetical protein n=1 Tax=Paraclostridium sordellii TaxID=1505 RepID=UPI0005428B7F|nr:hypothetical protein [Paeniclostridium sordellii]CEK34282.1 hypothetical protein UMC2_34931 [[Clostridium] sordellii] [Paeniclostridium sordellii]